MRVFLRSFILLFFFVSSFFASEAQPAQFQDDFSVDSRSSYTVTDTWTQGGYGQVLYDAAGKRLRINTGDDIGLSIFKSVPALGSGVFAIDFLPISKHPNGGEFRIRLKSGANSYYQLSNSDGYGAYSIKKVVNGQKVASASFQNEYRQGTSYSIIIRFSAGAVTAEAFGETLVMTGDSTALLVDSFEVNLVQQDAYLDNIFYGTEDKSPPVWDGPVGVCSAEDAATGGSVIVNFGTATDEGGSAVSYNVYYAPAAFWRSDDWSANNKIFDALPATGIVCSKAFTVGGLQSGTAYRFGVRAEDEFGNEDTNTHTVLATPTGAQPAQFLDDFSVDSRSSYTVTDTWTQGGYGEVLYDAAGKRLRINTGDDIGLAVSKSVSALGSGVFTIDFLPISKHPNGGEISIRLKAGSNSYYQLSNSDGYGAYSIKKVVNGQKVDSASFQNEYRQGTSYSIIIRFSAGTVTADAFGETLVMSGDSTALLVDSFEVNLVQQDAYVDNIFYGTEDTTPPVWDGPVGVCSVEDAATGGSVIVNFGTATDEGGSAVSYNAYYAPSDLWRSDDWSANNIIFDAPPASGSVCSKAFTVGGLQSGTAYRFGVRAEDEFGNEDTNTHTVLATPTGAQPAQFQDDFSVDSRSSYTVTDTWTQGGYGEVLYDAAGKRLRINTGDDIGLAVSKSVSALGSGVFTIDFLPISKHPNGGEIRIRLKAGSNSYYQLSNSDGYGAYSIKKVVNGQKVDSASFQNEYRQGTSYSIIIRFSAGTATAEAFGETLVMSGDSTALLVDSFEVSLVQQDAYIDDIIFSDQPFVAISHPQSYYLQASPELPAKAFGGNFQPGWGVQFTLVNKTTGASQVVNDFAEPFEHLYHNLSLNEYSIEARIIDSNFIPVEGDFTNDFEDPVGIGDYYVAFGDSITKGDGDDIDFDNISSDSRTVGAGYRPILSDLLKNEKVYPHLIVSEGKGGDDSGEGLARIQTALDAHPEANYYLVLFGTNDSDGSLPVPSGLDGNGTLLNPKDPGYSGSFLDNMQQIINAVYAAGKRPILAKVPITLGPCSNCVPFVQPETAARNLLIQEYNVVIDALVDRNSIGIVPPDFYNYFKLHQDEFDDNLHPNGMGYQSMADLWFEAITTQQ